MADTFRNPYSYTSPIGAALADLTRTIISGPSRAEKIQAAEEMLAVKRENENLLKAQTLLATPGYDPNAFAAAALGGGLTGDSAADFNLLGAPVANLDEAFRRAGGAYSGTQAGFNTDQANQNMRAANTLAETVRHNTATENETARQFNMDPLAAIVNGQPTFVPQGGAFMPNIAPVLSETENKALAAQNLFPELSAIEKRRYIGVDPSMSDFANVVNPAGQVSIADPATVQSMVGQPGAMVVGKENAAGDAGLTTGTLGSVQREMIDLDLVDANIDAATNLVSSMNDNDFGATGNVQQIAQDAVVLANNLAQGLGLTSAQEAIAAFQKEATAAGVNPNALIGTFDPRFPERNTLFTVLAYAAAKAQSGGGVLSNQDIAAGWAAIGDPDSLFASKQSILAKLQQVKAMNARKRGVLQNATGGGMPAPAPTAAPPAIPQGMQPGNSVTLPDGTIIERVQ